MIANDGVFDGKRILSSKAIREMQADQVRGALVKRDEFVERVPGLTHNGIYGLGKWREQLDAHGNAVLISSPSWAGAYPWIDKTTGVYGFFIAHVNVARAGGNQFDGFFTIPALATMVRDIVTEKPEPKLPHFKSGFIPVQPGGLAELYYQEAGTGAPVVLIHAYSMDCRMCDGEGGKQSSEQLLAAIPGAKRVVIKDAGHFSNLEQPEQFNRDVIKFIESARH